MQIAITARHGHLDEEVTAKIREKAEKLLHFLERTTMITVTVDLRGEDKVVEILLDSEHKHDFVARAEAPDPVIAMAAASDKMKAQIKHYTEKTQDHRRDPSHGGTDGLTL